MKKKKSRFLRWLRWIILSLLLLPIVALIFLRVFGDMRMRKPDAETLKLLPAHLSQKKIGYLHPGERTISYLLTSNGEHDEAILFVHGSPGSLDAYLKYMSNDSLLAHADLIVYDRPGFGYSDYGNTEPSLKGQAQILSSLIDSLNYSGYWLVGHSYGASVIVQAAIDYPEKIRGLGIIAGSVNYDLEPKSYWRKWINLPLIREILPTSLRVSNQELMTLKEDLKFLDYSWTKISLPVSLMHGTKDMLVPFDNLNLTRAKLVNADTIRMLIFEEENHFILWTQKDQIVKEISALISR